MRTIPVDLILHELAARLAELPDTQHRDLHRAISRGCIRPQSLAEEWTSGAGVAQQAAWLARRLDDENMTAPRLREIAAETRAMEVAIARRLADCALSLLVAQDAEDAVAAQALLQAAQRVVGLAPAKPHAEVGSTANGLLHRLVAALNLNPGTPESEAIATAAKLASGAVYLDRLRDSDGLLAAAIKREQDIATALRLPTTASQSDIIAHAKTLVDADKSENVNKASIAAAIERENAWLLWATKLAGQGHEQSSSKALREALSARLIDPKGQHLKVARDCLPPNVDIIVCMRGNDPATYRASNADEEHDTPEAAVRAAWGQHLRPTQVASSRAFKVGDKVRFARLRNGEQPWNRAPPLGWEGEITDIDESCLPIRVLGQAWDSRGGEQGWWFAAACLDLVTPTA